VVEYDGFKPALLRRVALARVHVAELPWWIPHDAQRWVPAPQPIVPVTTCPAGTEPHFGQCRNDCRFGPCGRKRIA
jgi:hypothetical protein